jgi:hypothetical protein
MAEDYEGSERRGSGDGYCTRHQAMVIAQEAGVTAAQEVLEGFGIFASSPEARAEYRKDMEHIRGQRRSCESVKAQSLRIAVGVVITGILGMLWLGFKKSGG